MTGFDHTANGEREDPSPEYKCDKRTIEQEYEDYQHAKNMLFCWSKEVKFQGNVYEFLERLEQATPNRELPRGLENVIFPIATIGAIDFSKVGKLTGAATNPHVGVMLYQFAGMRYVINSTHERSEPNLIYTNYCKIERIEKHMNRIKTVKEKIQELRIKGAKIRVEDLSLKDLLYTGQGGEVKRRTFDIWK